MSRSRSTDAPQKLSPRGLPQLMTSSSSSEPLHLVEESRSHRGGQNDQVNKKKLGTRIADLESQLGQAQDELKSLKDQLVSAEPGKKVAQEHLEKKSKKQQNVPEAARIQETCSSSLNTKELDVKNSCSLTFRTSDDTEKENDVFEVPVVTKTEHKPPMSEELSNEMHATSEPKNLSFDELGSKSDEISSLKSKLNEKDKELGVFRQENAGLKKELNVKSLNLSSAQTDIKELILRIGKADQELETSKDKIFRTNEKLEVAEKAKEELEIEIKRLRVQTEQWKKAADVGASVLAGEADINGRRTAQRCGSMNIHYGGAFGHAGYVGSPGMIDDDNDEFDSAKRKGSGIKMFGDIRRKKG